MWYRKLVFRSIFLTQKLLPDCFVSLLLIFDRLAWESKYYSCYHTRVVPINRELCLYIFFFFFLLLTSDPHIILQIPPPPPFNFSKIDAWIV